VIKFLFLVTVSTLAFVTGAQVAQAADPKPLPRTSIPEYAYECKSGERYIPGFVCTLSEIFNPTQTAYDPRPGQTLMDQIPNHDGEALNTCVGHLGIPDSELKPGQSNRC
jgi:hypothetical protein